MQAVTFGDRKALKFGRQKIAMNLSPKLAIRRDLPTAQDRRQPMASADAENLEELSRGLLPKVSQRNETSFLDKHVKTGKKKAP